MVFEIFKNTNQHTTFVQTFCDFSGKVVFRKPNLILNFSLFCLFLSFVIFVPFCEKK